MSTATIKLYDLFRNEIASKDFVKKEITDAKNDMIKWFVGLFFALALMIIGLYIKK